MLNNMLLAMQDKAARFEWVRIVPASAFELQLTKREVVADKMDEGGPGSGKNIFELFSILRLHEYCKSYILFFISSIKHSQLLFSLCDKTFNSGSLDEMTWERLKMSLMSAIAFYEKLSEYLTPKYLQQTILVNSSICQDGDYIDRMGLFLAYFESYDSVQDLGEDILQNIFLLHHAIILFLTVWKRYDWKSRIDWKHPRKELLTAYLSLLKRYDPLLSLLAPNDAPEAYPAKLKKMQDKMKEELELNERTA